MKKILFTLTSALLINFTALAQFTASGEFLYTGTLSNPDDDELKTHIDIVNSSGTEMVVKAYRQLVDVIEGSQNRFCWGGVCYDYDDNVSFLSNYMADGEIIAADALIGFTGYYNHLGNTGCSHINYCFYDVDDNTVQTCFEVRYTIDSECVVSVSDMDSQNIMQLNGANPIVDRFSIQYDLARFEGSNKLVIRTITGALVKEVQLTGKVGFVMLDANEFASGVYIYSLTNDERILASDKLVVSK